MAFFAARRSANVGARSFILRLHQQAPAHELDSGFSAWQRGWILSQTRGLKAAPKLTEVILTADLKKVGKAGDIVKVAKGYARNWLIPQLLALPKLDKYVNLVQKQLEAMKADQPKEEEVKETEESKTEEQNLKEINMALQRLENQRVVFRRSVPRGGGTTLHKFIAPKDIVYEVRRQQNVHIEEVNLEMSSVIQTLGDHEIPLRLPSTIQIPSGLTKINLKVRVRRP